MKWKTTKKVLRKFERGLAFDMEEYFSRAESVTSVINEEQSVEMFRSSIMLLIEKLKLSLAWPFKDRWIEGVGWGSMVATTCGRVAGLGELWWGNANDFSAGLIPEPLQLKIRLLSVQKRNPVSYWMKLGTGAGCHQIFGSKDTSANPYLTYSSIERSEFSETPLMQAANEGDTVIASGLLASGADPNSITLDGYTALMFAAMFGHDEMARILLFSGASTNMQSQDGVTALMLAARFGHLGIVDNLLAVGCEIDAKDQYGQTALRLACDRSHVEFRHYKEIAKILKQAGARE